MNPTSPMRRAVRSALSNLATFGAVLALLLGIWVLFLQVFDINPFFGKTPGDVWEWLTDAEEGATRRSEMWSAFLSTFWDALVGFAVGTAFAVLVAISFVLSRSVERAFMPIALTLRSVPIVAMIPLLATIFGRGAIGTLVVIGIIVWFPTLVLVTNGLRSVSDQAVELMAAYDASKITTLLKVRLPSALPSLFASAKVGAPLAILGALLNEWLMTGGGLGELMVLSTTSAQYARLWAAVVLVTVVSIVLAAAVSAAESLVLARYAPDRLVRS